MKALALLLLTVPAVAALAAPVPEPETVLYGRILDRSGPVDRVLTDGLLVWKVRKADGTELPLSASLFPYRDGAFSYSLRVPQEALSLGLTASSGAVGLAPQPTRQAHLEITVDGRPAVILPPSESVFDTMQATRAMTLRVDLGVSIPASDTDGDGMADWWEDANGFDKQNAADAAGDKDGDGRSNLAEFLAGSDPGGDDRLPRILTTEVIAYAGGKSLVLVETADTDSSPQQLKYTLLAPPATGRLIRRNPDTVLKAGDVFTQEDVARGRLLFEHSEGTAAASFEVSVRDENPAHPADTGRVQVMVFDPVSAGAASGTAEALRLAAHAAVSGEGAFVADLGAQSGLHRLAAASGGFTAQTYESGYVAAFGADRPHFLFGGSRADTLTGSMLADTLWGGNGDDELTGSGGADRFVMTSQTEGSDTVTDFDPSQGDVIDITAVLHGASLRLTDYVRITRSGTDALLGVDADGVGGTYADMVIRLRNSPLTQADLRSLSESGALVTGDIGLPPQVTILASVGRASENGAPWGLVTVLRSGGTARDLLVPLQISGSATNGVDYEMLASQVTIPAGAQSATLTIRPYQDAVTELDEVVLVSVLTSPEFESGVPSSAQVIIEDLKPQISVEVLNPLASVSDLSPAAFLINRSGATDRSVLVRLNISGTAGNGTDYNRIDNFLSLGAFQTSGVVQITPKPTATISGGAESVVLTVKPDAAYRVGSPVVAGISIVPETIDLDRWKAANYPGNSQPSGLFAAGDPGGAGVPNLLRYAFGLNPASPRTVPALLPQAELLNGHLALRFHRTPAATDLEYRVETSSDMKTWTDAGPEVEDLTFTQSPGDPSAALYRVTQPASQSPIRFLRVRIVRTQP